MARRVRIAGRPVKVIAQLLDRSGTLRSLGALGVVQKHLDAPVDDAPAEGAVVARHADADAPARAINLERLANARPGRRGFPSVAAVASSFSSGASSPTQALDAFFAGLAASDALATPLSAFVPIDDVMRARARAAAEASAARWRSGTPRSVIDGMPFSVKDQVDVKGTRTGLGTRAPFPIATSDAAVVERLEGLGAVLVGKNRMHEMGAGTTGFSLDGVSRNPWKLAHVCGGSSSGTASAVAAGMFPFALGADGGGSIRMPASLSGIVGLKPTFGRISKVGSARISPSMGHLGPMAPSVVDTVVGFAAMTGRDARDADSMKQPPLNEDALVAALSSTDLRGLRLGVDRGWIASADAAIAARFWDVAAALEQRGAKLVDAGLTPAEHERFKISHAVCIADEVATFLKEHPTTFAELSDAGRIGFLVGRALSPQVRERAKRHRVAAARRFAQLFNDVDVLITPTTAKTAAEVKPDLFPHGELDIVHLQALIRFTSHGNLVGNPSMTVPIGFLDGLPLGLLVHGKDFDEATVIRVCAVAEDVARDVVDAGVRAFSVPSQTG